MKNSFFELLAIVIIGCLLFSQSAFAANIGQLYEASVKADGAKSENKLIADAFKQVIVKVSGRSGIVVSKDILKKAESAISQFRYDYKRQAVTSETTEPAAEDSEANKEKWFWVRFNQKMVNTLLKEAQIPIWGKVRPQTLIWFSRELKGKRLLQSQHDEPEIYDIFTRQAQLRGISLIFPFLDLQDQSTISSNDIWGNYNDAILLASKRYQAQTTLTVRLFKESTGLWVAKWNLLMLGETQSWTVRNEQLAVVLSSGIDGLADRLSRQFAQLEQDSGDNPGLLVAINNINNFKSYQLVDDYLRNLATVRSFMLVQIKRDKLFYRVHYHGTQNSLIQEVRMGDLLNPVELSRDAEMNSPDNDYKPVILDELDKTRAENPPLSVAQPGDNQTQSSVSMAGNNLAAKVVPVLQADLEYWFTR